MTLRKGGSFSLVGGLATAGEHQEHKRDHGSQLVIERGAGAFGCGRICDRVLREAVEEAPPGRPLLTPLHDGPQEC